MESLSDFLFPRPSFLEGVSRVLDLGGTANVEPDGASTSSSPAPPRS
jgi:hypothetical protein